MKKKKYFPENVASMILGYIKNYAEILDCNFTDCSAIGLFGNRGSAIFWDGAGSVLRGSNFIGNNASQAAGDLQWGAIMVL